MGPEGPHSTPTLPFAVWFVFVLFFCFGVVLLFWCCSFVLVLFCCCCCGCCGCCGYNRLTRQPTPNKQNDKNKKNNLIVQGLGDILGKRSGKGKSQPKIFFKIH